MIVELNNTGLKTLFLQVNGATTVEAPAAMGMHASVVPGYAAQGTNRLLTVVLLVGFEVLQP